MGEGGLGVFEFSLQIVDALPDEGGVDASLDGGELTFEAFVDGADLVAEALAFGTAVVVELTCEQLCWVRKTASRWGPKADA